MVISQFTLKEVIRQMPSSMSLAVSLISSPVVSTRIHSNIDMVVLLGTAFDTVCTPVNRLDFVHTIFICE